MAVEIKNFMRDLEKAGTVHIAGHINPDGDAVGSCFALALFVEILGFKPVILIDSYAEKFRFLRGGEFIYSVQEKGMPAGADMLVCLDCAAKGRLGSAEAVFDIAKVTYNIDHHISNTHYAEHNFVDSGASSACEVLFDLINMNCAITKDIAAALYTGIVTDTGSFRHSGTSPRTHEIAAALMSVGIDFSYIQRCAVYEHSIIEARAFGLAVGGMCVKPEQGYAFACLDDAQMKSIDASGTDLDGIAEFLLNTKDTAVSALFSEREPGYINISLRSVKLDVNSVAEQFGGGGHLNAAGARVAGDIKTVSAAVAAAIEKAAARG